jgi:hypothetical protein|nr:MAG TPA: hypothetical protein [Caudoviricetes sp.]
MVDKEQIVFQSNMVVDDEINIGRVLLETQSTSKRDFRELKKEISLNFSKDRLKRAMASAKIMSLGGTRDTIENLKLSELSLLTNKKIDENDELINLRTQFLEQRITIEEFKEKYKLILGKIPKSEYEKFLGHLKSMEDKVVDIEFPEEEKEEIRTKINMILGCIE